jgi:hypothetical protein
MLKIVDSDWNLSHLVGRYDSLRSWFNHILIDLSQGTLVILI